MVDIGERKLVTHEREGALKNLLNKSYLKRWIGPLAVTGNEVDGSPNNEGKIFNQRPSSVDFARHVLILGVCYSDFIPSINDWNLDSLRCARFYLKIPLTNNVSFQAYAYLHGLLIVYQNED